MEKALQKKVDKKLRTREEVRIYEAILCKDLMKMDIYEAIREGKIFNVAIQRCNLCVQIQRIKKPFLRKICAGAGHDRMLSMVS